MTYPLIRTAARPLALVAALVLAGCGGGGGGTTASTATSPSLAAVTTLSSMTAPATFPATIPTAAAVDPTGWQAVVAAIATLPPTAGTTWVHVWSTGVGGEPITLALIAWTPGMPAPVIQRPATGAAVKFEAYNTAGTVTGTL